MGVSAGGGEREVGGVEAGVESVEAGGVLGVGVLGGEDGQASAREVSEVGLALLVGHLRQAEELALGVEAPGEEAGLGAKEGGGGLGTPSLLRVALGLGERSGRLAFVPCLGAGVEETDPGLGDLDGGAGSVDRSSVEELVERPRGREAPRVAGPAGDGGVGRVVALGRDGGEGEPARRDRDVEVDLGAEAGPVGRRAQLVAGEGEAGLLDAERRLGGGLGGVGERRQCLGGVRVEAVERLRDRGGGERQDEEGTAHQAVASGTRAWTRGASSGRSPAVVARSRRKPSPTTGRPAKSASVWPARSAWKPGGISA